LVLSLPSASRYVAPWRTREINARPNQQSHKM
jgi:hypothetical protein